MRHSSTSLALIAAIGLSFDASAATGQRPPIDGFWDTPGGRVRLVRNGSNVTGTLVTGAGGVKLGAGDKVLQGVFEDDNLSAEVKVELVLPSCHNDKTKAFVVMLLTRSGKLTGGVSTKDKCAAGVATLAFKRSDDQSSGKDAKAVSVAPGQANAPGKPAPDLRSAARPLMEEGAQYLNEGQFEKARDLFQKATEKDPALGEAFNGVGITYYARNDYDSAVSWYKRGLEAAPGFGDLYYNIACAYAQLGKASIALRYLKLAVAKGYTEVDAMDKDPDLDPLRHDPGYVQLRQSIGDAPAAPQR